MSGKRLYKKTAGSGWDRDPNSLRPKENRFFEKAQSEIVGSRKKSKAKGTPRADHKHEYKPVLAWRKSWRGDGVRAEVVNRCVACGKIEDKYAYFFGKDRLKYYGDLAHFWQDERENLTPIDGSIHQKKIFLGGSKIINALAEGIKETLFSLMNCGHEFLTGDCMGADLQLQKLLAENGYRKVTVYYSGDRPRVNLGNWRTIFVSSNRYLTNYERQKLKDDRMAVDCDFGVMLLKGATKGTMANVVKLVELNKRCEVFVEACGDLKKYAGYKTFGVDSSEDVDYLKRRLQTMGELK